MENPNFPKLFYRLRFPVVNDLFIRNSYLQPILVGCTKRCYLFVKIKQNDVFHYRRSEKLLRFFPGSFLFIKKKKNQKNGGKALTFSFLSWYD